MVNFTMGLQDRPRTLAIAMLREDAWLCHLELETWDTGLDAGAWQVCHWALVISLWEMPPMIFFPW